MLKDVSPSEKEFLKKRQNDILNFSALILLVKLMQLLSLVL